MMNKLILLIAATLCICTTYGQTMGGCATFSLCKDSTTTRSQWDEKIRFKLLDILSRNNYGYTAQNSSIKTSYEIIGLNTAALQGTATQKQVRVTFTNGTQSKSMTILMLIPNCITKPSVFLGYNFHGNYTITKSPDVAITDKYVFHRMADKSIETHAKEQFRGSAGDQWAIQDMMSRGYALATIHYADIYEDCDSGYNNSIGPIIYDGAEAVSKKCDRQGLWAWGLLRAMDYLQGEPLINPKRVFVTGVSRLGKVALYAGAQDQRFAMVVAHCAGGVSKPSDNKDILLALVAPRPLYSTTSEKDIYAVPALEFNYLKGSNKIYEMFGKHGIASDILPLINTPVLDHNIGFHIKPGGHRVERYDWEQAMNFADRRFGKPKIELPNLLKYNNGGTVKTAKEWTKKRRPQIIELLETEQYGRIPANLKFKTKHRILSLNTNAFNGLATRKEVEITISRANHSCSFNLLVYTPNKLNKPAAMFLGANFGGNYTVCNDPGISVPDATTYSNPKYSVNPNKRGADSASWNIEQTLRHGYGVATLSTADIFEDMPGGGTRGAATMSLLYGQKRDSISCGFIGCAAWALSRAMDYLETDSDVNAKRIAVTGCSRNGKIALWAGALDTRLAMVISSSSGSGGASLYRGNSTETLAAITKRFPHWMCDNYKRHALQASILPFDQHMLLALIAPRPLYVANSDRDKYVFSRNEFESIIEAGKVYELMGCFTLNTTAHPPVNAPIINTIGYHTKSGEHSITLYDWQQYWKFADKHFQ